MAQVQINAPKLGEDGQPMRDAAGRVIFEIVVRDETPEEEAERLSIMAPVPAADPVDKLKAFLAANPDVAEALK